MSKAKVALGVVSYGGQEALWWKPMLDLVGHWIENKNIEYGGTFHSGVSTPDINRNIVADKFLNKSDADYLMWIDADNPPAVGMVERLLQAERPLVSGLYYGGDMRKGMEPIAYVRNQKGGYHTLRQVKPQWNKGELLPVDAVGMGCFLTHRSVYEDIMENYDVYQRVSGGKLVIRKDMVKGEIPEDANNHPYKLQVRKGTLYDPVVQYDMTDQNFPFFMCQYGRTEDYVFCEMARDLDYPIFVDTFVEVGHVKAFPFTGIEFREQHGYTPDDKMEEIDYVG